MGKSHKPLFDAAEAFCALVEAANPDDDEWLDELSRLLPRLHALIADLQPTLGDATPDDAIDLDSRFELYSHLHETLGDRDGYWLEFDSPGGRVTGSLADDLTDIYFDLKQGLERQQMEHDPGPTLCEWQAGFALHWGQHLVDAERHLYALNTRNQLV